MFLNHLLVPIRIKEIAKEVEHLRLVKLAQSAPPTERYSAPQAPHHAHYDVIRRIDPRVVSIVSLPRHHRAA